MLKTLILYSWAKFNWDYLATSVSLSHIGSRVWSEIHGESLSRRQPLCGTGPGQLSEVSSQRAWSQALMSEGFQWPSTNARAADSSRGQRVFLPARLCFGATFHCTVKFPPPMHIHNFHLVQDHALAWLAQDEHGTLFGVLFCDINGEFPARSTKKPLSYCWKCWSAFPVKILLCHLIFPTFQTGGVL